jgi:hypothetical protein
LGCRSVDLKIDITPYDETSQLKPLVALRNVCCEDGVDFLDKPRECPELQLAT